MRNAREIRERTAKILVSMLLRPSMWGTGQSYEVSVRSQLEDLAFIDGREEELERALDGLEVDGLYSRLGTWGVLAHHLGPGQHTAELASILARIAAELDYFEPERCLNAAEWNEMQAVVEPWARAEPRRCEDVVARFGPPAYAPSARPPDVLAYAGPGSEAWLYFDFASRAPQLLQRVRLPGAPFADRLLDLTISDGAEAGPEHVYRRLFTALPRGREAEIRPLLVAHTDPVLLWQGAYPDDVADLLTEQARTMNVIRVPPPDDTVYLISDVCPVPVAVQRDGAAWRVNPEPYLRMRTYAPADG